MLTNEVKTAIKDLTKEQIIEGVRTGTIIPPKGEARGEFFAFSAKTPEERNAEILNGQAAQVPGEPASSVEEKDAKGEPVVVPPTSIKEDWEELGYKSKADFVEAHKNLLKTVPSLQATIDGLNAKEGKRGQELRQLREEREQLLKKVEPSSKPALVKPEKPKKPISSNFEDGIYDAKYIAARDEYEDAYEQYTEKLVEFNTIKNKEEVTAYVENTVQSRMPETKTEEDDGFKTLFNEAIPKFQEKFGLTTTVSIEALSNAYNMINSGDAVKIARGNAFIKSVSEGDLKKYALVKDAVEKAYDFSSGKALPKYRTIEGALYDAGMLGNDSPYNPAMKTAALSPEEERAAIELKMKQNNSTVSAIPSSTSSSQDTPITDAVTLDEKKKRYKDVMTKYNEALLTKGGRENFEKSPMYEEYIKLRTDIFGKAPVWKR
jgi:hypothetical protein